MFHLSSVSHHATPILNLKTADPFFQVSSEVYLYLFVYLSTHESCICRSISLSISLSVYVFISSVCLHVCFFRTCGCTYMLILYLLYYIYTPYGIGYILCSTVYSRLYPGVIILCRLRYVLFCSVSARRSMPMLFSTSAFVAASRSIFRFMSVSLFTSFVMHVCFFCICIFMCIRVRICMCTCTAFASVFHLCMHACVRVRQRLGGGLFGKGCRTSTPSMVVLCHRRARHCWQFFELWHCSATD